MPVAKYDDMKTYEKCADKAPSQNWLGSFKFRPHLFPEKMNIALAFSLYINVIIIVWLYKVIILLPTQI
jgi:hypothetical protein